MRNDFIIWTVALLIIAACNNSTGNSHNKEKTGSEKSTGRPGKPPSNYQDTLEIDFIAAIFYHPDSVQLAKIRELEEKGVYDATMHEYFYQMRNARLVITKSRPDVKIIDATKARYLLFKKANKETKIIDLDTKGDPHGLFFFDPKQDPAQVDMMNIDTELPRYFSGR